MMTHRVSKQANAFASVLAILGMLLVFIPAIFIVGPHVEGSKFPVLQNVKLELLGTEKGQMIFHITGEKLRSCKLTELKVLVDEDGPGPHLPRLGKITSLNDDKSERPLGLQDFGLWAIEPVGGKLTIQANYDCHPFWDTVVKVGEWSKP